MIYLDSSVALAELLSEVRRPSGSFWRQPMSASRLLQYEVWNRLHRLNTDQDANANTLLGRVGYLEMSPDVLERALQPFPIAVRTLDGLHLATMSLLRTRGKRIELASYDLRLLAAAEAMGFQTLQP